MALVLRATLRAKVRVREGFRVGFRLDHVQEEPVAAKLL